MFSMQTGIKRLQASAMVAVLAGVVPGANVAASGLTLEEAEALALLNDPGIKAVEASRQALSELAVADAQLPDPMLKMGLVSLPADSFDLGQEAMTQVQLGLVQKFPRGDTRDLRARQTSLKSESLDEVARDKSLQIALAVREQFFEVLKQEALARINAGAIASFTDLTGITREYYASGRAQQQDVLQAAVELAKTQDRASRIAQDEDQARTRLATWIGEAAYRDIDESWPDAALSHDAESIKAGLPDHPRIRALQKGINASETGIELARQAYKPGFSLDLTYGGRGGRNPDGSTRADLLTFMVVMDVPLFTKNRQDRVVASQVAESSGAAFTRDDVLRRMRSEVEFHTATLKRQQERIALFETALLPDAAFSSEASLEAYQSSVADLTTLLRTRITEFDLQLEHARLQAELLKTRARLQYFEGI